MKLKNISIVRTISFLFIIAFHILRELMGEGTKFRGVFPLFFASHIFFFVSGFLYANKKILSIKAFYIKNALKLFVPTILCILLYFIFSLINQSGILVFSEFISNAFLPLGHLWFVFMIMACYILLPLFHLALDKTHPKHKLALTLTILLLVAETICVPLTDFQACFLVFFLGVLVGNKKEGFFTSSQYSKKGWLISCFSLLLFIASSLAYFFIDKFLFATNIMMGLGWTNYIVALQALSFSSFTLYILNFTNKTHPSKLLSFCDKYSFYIYLAHNPLIAGNTSLLHLTPYTSLNILLSLSASLFVAIILENISSQLLSKATKPIQKYDK